MGKIIFSLVCTLLLSGCFTVPVKMTFPEAPQVLLVPCASLKTIDADEVVLSEFLHTVTNNYAKHHECALMVESWQDWYKAQKEIFNKVK